MTEVKKTESKTTEEELRQSLLKETIAGGMMGGYLEDGFPVYFINRRMLEYLGYEKEEDFVQDNAGLIENCMHPEDREYVNRECLQQIAAGGEYQVEYRMRKRDGSYIWMHDVGRKLTTEDGRDAIISVCYDITKDKEHTLLIDSLINNANGGLAIYRVDDNWRMTPIYASAGVGSITARDEKEYLELCEDDAIKSIYIEDCEAVLHQIQEAVREDKATTLTYRVPDTDGGYQWINGIFSKFGEEKGHPIVRAVFMPISIQYDLQLQTLDQDMLGICVIDAKTNELYYANDVCFELHGSEPCEIAGRTCYDALIGRDCQCEQCFYKLVTEEQKDWEYEVVNHERVLLVSAQKKKWNQKDVWVEYIRDVTEQHRLQEETRQQAQQAIDDKKEMMADQELLYAALFSMIPMVISVNLTQNSYAMMNYDNFTTKAAAESGSFDELIKVGASTLPDEDREQFVQTFGREQLIAAYENGAKKVSLEHRQYGDDGILRWMETQVIFVRNQVDGDLHEITLVHDITKEKEQQLKLEEALEDARRAGSAKSDFLSRMSHDLRTPMNAIIGLTALTIDEAGDPKAVCENMTQMRSASDFMLRLINDILDMAKIEEGTTKLILEPYRYSDFVMEMRTMFQAQCDEKGIRLSIMEPFVNPICMTDKLRLKQIFFNIISNAVKYTPMGGEISFGFYNVTVSGKYISGEYRISDTGIGMSEKFKQHLFEPFAQEDSRVTPELQGTGLGLSITKQLVDLLGGKIEIESEKGRGTTVIVKLSFEMIPDDSYLKKNEEKRLDSADDILSGKRVLLVEDHPMNAQIARKILEKKNMIVMHAENGRIAVDMFNASSEKTFDFILMDIRMPEMSGLEATKVIRRLPRADAATVPIIAMSANAYAEDIQMSLDAGMNGHLAKPVNPQELYETIEKFLD